MLAAGVFAGSVVYRRRTARRVERVEIYAADGAMASIGADTPDGARLLSLARALVAVAS